MTTAPTSTRASQINTLINALVAAGIWAQLDVLYVTAAADSQAARLNWKSPSAFTLAEVNAPTFAADRGYTGNGTTSRLESSWVPSVNGVNFTQDNASLWVWPRTAGQSAAQDIGVNTSPGAFIVARSASDNLAGRLNEAVVSGVGNTDGSGFIGLSRVSSTIRRYWRNGAQIATDNAATSAGLPTSSLWLLGGNSTSFSTRQEAAGAWGASLAGKELAFYNAMQTYMTAVGA